MLKYIGIAVIASVSVGYGVLYSFSLKNEYRRLNGFLKLARRIRMRIECFHQPLDEIYSDFSEEALDEVGFTAELKKSGFIPALCKTKGTLGIRGEILSLLGEFGTELGKSYAEDQIRHCDRYIYLMEEKATELESELPQKTKTARTLSAAVAVMAAILLI